MNNGNKPAMPVETIGRPEYGLTKREYFATMAMQGLLASDINENIDVFARYSVKCADALLKALEADNE